MLRVFARAMTVGLTTCTTTPHTIKSHKIHYYNIKQEEIWKRWMYILLFVRVLNIF